MMPTPHQPDQDRAEGELHQLGGVGVGALALALAERDLQRRPGERAVDDALGAGDDALPGALAALLVAVPGGRLERLPDDQGGETEGDHEQGEAAQVGLGELPQGAAAGDLSLALAEHQLEAQPGDQHVHHPVADEPNTNTGVERVIVIHGRKLPARLSPHATGRVEPSHDR